MESFNTIKTLKDKIDRKEVTPQEVLSHYLRRCSSYDKHIQSALELFEQSSIEQASHKGGALYGIPCMIKDNIAQKDRGLTCASKILENFVSTYDATAIERLKKEGAFLVGRSNLDEFAMGSSTETSAFQKTKNPWDLDRVPGGSSGGSAAAVAAGLVPFALGTDTGGSVRQPAAFCGIVGFKPTYGLVSRYGLVAYGSSLDQIGVFAHTVYDAALVCSVIAGNDSRDSTTAPIAQKDYTRGLDGALPTGLRIGVVDNALYAEGVDQEVVSAIEQALEIYQKLGATVTHVTLPTFDYAAATYFIISRAEAASNLARFDGVRYGMRVPDAHNLKDMYCRTRHDGFGQEVKARIMLGNYVLSSGHAGEFYEKAKKVQSLIRSEFMTVFKDIDILIMPTNPAPAFRFGAFGVNKLQIDLQDYFTCPMNLSGNPAISIPCGLVNKLPIGMQLIAPHFEEERLFRIAHAYQQHTSWHTMHPEGF